MEVKEMQFTEFLNEIHKTSASQYKFKGTTWAYIYSFYKNNPQTFVYKIVVGENQTIPYDIERSKELFQQYGIYFDSIPEGFVFGREFVLILSKESVESEDTIREKLQELGTELSSIAGFSNPKVTAIMVEQNYAEIGSGIKWNSLRDRLDAVFGGPINLCNGSAYNVKTQAKIFDGNMLQQYRDRYGDHFHYKNLYFVFQQSKYTDRAVSDESRYNMLRWAFEELKRVVQEIVTTENNTLFYYSPEELGAPKIFNTVYLEFVAYWVATHKNNPFVVETSDLGAFYRYLNTFRNKKFMYCNEWIDSLVNPLDFGLFTKAQSTEIDLLCTRDLNENCAEMVKLSLIFVGFDLESRRINGNTVYRENLSVSQIKPLAIQKLYQLDEKDNAKALSNLAELNALVGRLENLLYPNGYNLSTVVEDLLTCSNVLLFEYKNHYFLGTVATVQASYTYFVQPILATSEIIKYNFSLEELDKLFPISVFADAASVLGRLPRIDLLQQSKEGLVTTYNMDRSYLDGFVLMGVPSTNKARLSNVNFTMEELGFWSPQTQELRVIVDSGLLEWLPCYSARKCSLMTFYGGPHPLHSTNFEITEEIFRR